MPGPDVPRSPFEAVEGLIWLPRMLDKARRQRATGLGEYLLFEDSPLDAHFLRAWRVGGADLTGWLDEGLDDAAVALKISERRGWDLAKREAWSGRARAVCGGFFSAIDADEGRLPPGPRAALLKGFLAVVFRAVSVGVMLKGRKHR